MYQADEWNPRQIKQKKEICFLDWREMRLAMVIFALEKNLSFLVFEGMDEQVSSWGEEEGYQLDPRILQP